MIAAQAVARDGTVLDTDTTRETLATGLSATFDGLRVLVLIPDHTRSLPLPLLFRSIVDVLAGARQLDFLIALGTHPPLTEQRLNDLVGITAAQRESTYRRVGIANHDWSDPEALQRVGTLPADQMKEIAGDRWHHTLGGDIPVRINRRIFDYDHVIIVGPTFPHEVVGFSGGAKYLFPGISGPEMIDHSHWLGALCGVVDTIGVADTPVRAMVHAAAARVTVPVTLVSLVVVGEDDLAAVFVGDAVGAWEAATAVSSQRHIVWVDHPFERVLSMAPPMYDELWTAGKAMYKLEPALANGGELIIYAPHLSEVSKVHGRYIHEVGYHVLEYFLSQWDRFDDVPLSVLAHSTHVRGGGTFRDGVDAPNASVVLATQISPDDCARLNLGYADPLSIDPDGWQGLEDEGVLLVPRAGEMLYRVRTGE